MRNLQYLATHAGILNCIHKFWIRRTDNFDEQNKQKKASTLAINVTHILFQKTRFSPRSHNPNRLLITRVDLSFKIRPNTRFSPYSYITL